MPIRGWVDTGGESGTTEGSRTHFPHVGTLRPDGTVGGGLTEIFAWNRQPLILPAFLQEYSCFGQQWPTTNWAFRFDGRTARGAETNMLAW